MNNLTLRILTALVMAPGAIAAAWLGGYVFSVFWLAATLAVLWEWTALTTTRDKTLLFMTGAAALCLSALLIATFERISGGVLILILGAMAQAVLAPSSRRLWAAGGVVYAGSLLVAMLLLRADAAWGFLAIVLLFAVVWTSDIAGYVVGRAVGGPKLAPAISPNKTWSGAIGGLLGAVVAAVVVARVAGLQGIAAIGMLAALLSAVAQAGDLFESGIKRRFDVKDASTLIPGHGGLMDRLDGFLIASVAALLIGLLRFGAETPAQGLLLW